MRIGFDAKRAYNNFSGLGNYSRYVLNNMVAMYPEDVMFAFTPKRNEELSKRVSKKLILQEPGDALTRSFHSIWRSLAWANIAESRRLDVFHGLSNELPAKIHKSRVKSVVTIHDLIFKRFPEQYKAVDRKIYDKKFRFACEVAEKVVAISEQTKSDITEFYDIPAEKIEVVYQDCDPAYHLSVSNEQATEVKEKYALPDRYILCVGTIQERKNQLRLVKAFHQLAPKEGLVLVGKKTAYSRELEDYIKKNNLEHKVRILENVESQDLPVIYFAASIFVYPSLFEGFGIPIIEAQNMGVPVITSTGSCFSETGGNAATYVDPMDTEALAAAMKDLLIDEMGNIERANEGKVNVMRFRAEKTIPQLHEVYESLNV